MPNLRSHDTYKRRLPWLSGPAILGARAHDERQRTCQILLDAGQPGGAAGESRPDVTDRRLALTRREREVAALIARGWSNPEIGAELVVTRRTVEAHISAILGKLGLSSRAQVAVWADRNGLGPAEAD
jgi:non-specific serine/threonine protein kinase